MTKVFIEPENIRFHRALIEIVGGDAVSIEIGKPELECTARADNGAHGTVSVPLTRDEEATLRGIVETATERAFQLVAGVVGRCAQRRSPL